MIDYAYVLSKKYPNSVWELSGNDYENLIWKSDDTKPTKKQLDDLWPVVQNEMTAEITAKAAARQAVLDKIGLTADEVAALLG